MTDITIFVPLGNVEPNPWQPRVADDPEHIEKIAHSIAADGLLQFPVARGVESDRYQLAFWHTRFRAYQFLNEQPETWFTEHGYPVKAYDKLPVHPHPLSDEAMFRHAVSENLARKDLNAIETASAMKRYRDEFRKSSVEIGALFGVNDATVRGTLRLLDLPTGARERLGKGELSQGAARALLSMRNLVTEDVIEQTAQVIVENDGRSTPANIIQNTLERQRNVLAMWQDGRDGKPRGGISWNGSERYWLLSMKNFPNQRLPELTLSDLPILLGRENDTQLLRVIAYAENALDAELRLGMMDNEAAKQMAETLAILRDPPSCDTCPLYGRFNGRHYCGLRACHMRKEEAWKKERMFSTGKRTGVELYMERDGQYLVLDAHDNQHQALWKERGPDLRLIERSKVRGYPSQFRFEKDGIDQELCVVCVVGKTMLDLKAAAKAERALERAGIRPTNTRYAMFQDKQERLQWEASGYFADELLGALNLDAVKALHGCVSYWPDDGPKYALLTKGASDEAQFDFLRRKLALNMLHRLRPTVMYDSESRTCVMDFYETIELAAQKAGICLPESLRRAAREADTEIDIAFPLTVSTETIAAE